MTRTEAARELDALGFPDLAESMLDTSEPLRELRPYLRRSVWWSYGHVGEPETRHFYVAAERLILDTEPD